jgi:ABC-type polysaccharide/polyol phosphate transport system ATPase subunit
VSFEVEPGETIGLIGANGAGKSTVLKLISRILVPDRGSVAVSGKVSALIELGAGFQLEYSGRENVYLNASLLGLSRAEIDRRFQDIVDFAELGAVIDDPLRTYSSGMYMRLGFAVAIHVDPEIMLVDEILAVGDESFQRKCFNWLEDFQRRSGTIVMISHNLGAIREMASKVAWLKDGRVAALGDADDVVTAYLDEVRETMAGPGMPADRRDQRLPELEVGEVRLLDVDGRPVEEIDAGDPLTVEIGYRVNRPVETPVVGVMLWRNDGTYVYGTSTHADGIDLGRVDRDGKVCLRYRSLPLLAGTYRLTVALFASRRANAAPVDYREQRYQFRVRHRTAEQGVVRFEHDWRAAGGD